MSTSTGSKDTPLEETFRPLPRFGIPLAAYKREVRRLAELALEEDIGHGDATSALFGPEEQGSAYLLAKEGGVASGTEFVKAVFRHLEPSSEVRIFVKDGERFKKGVSLGEVRATVRTLLTGERVALNFLQRLSGVATLTSQYVNALGPGSPIQILDTRKTTPLLRLVEKMAVVHGGGFNHRLRLDDMVMIKNNHVDKAGGVTEAVTALTSIQGKRRRSAAIPLCIEARTLAEALDAAKAGADIVLLDNMNPRQVQNCAEKIRVQAKTLGMLRPHIEVSGGITLARIRWYRPLEIQRISVGALTHSAPALDISMRML